MRNVWCGIFQRKIPEKYILILSGALRRSASSKDAGSKLQPSRLPFGECMKRREIAADERFLFRAGLALQLPLSCDRVGDAIEILLENEHDRTAPCGIAPALCFARRSSSDVRVLPT
jgi:hypothetical protein